MTWQFHTTGRILSALVLAVGAALAGCGEPGYDPAQQIPGGNPARGAQLVQQFGCTSCHIIPGVASAGGTVGPPLSHWAKRTYIAGTLTNTPEQLMRWIMIPQSVLPGNAMPDLGVTREQAADIAAYLYTIH